MKTGKNKDLKIKKGSTKSGALVFAVIGDYKGKGKQRVILHEVTLEKTGNYSYGNKRTWNFPTR